MTKKYSLHLKPDGLIGGTHPRSGNLPHVLQSCRECVYRNTASTFTFTPLGYRIYAQAETVYTEQETAAIPHGSGTTSALGRAIHHTTMTTNEQTSDARRPSDLRHDETNAKKKAGANQREKASQDVSLGARDLNCTRAFSRTGLKRYPARAVALSSRAYPSTRRVTSHASNHTTTHVNVNRK